MKSIKGSASLILNNRLHPRLSSTNRFPYLLTPIAEMFRLRRQLTQFFRRRPLIPRVDRLPVAYASDCD